MKVERQTLTVAETATVLGLSVRTVYALAEKGELPGLIRIGGSIRVSVSELERFLHPSENGSREDA